MEWSADVVVVGAGQAGLGLARVLQDAGLDAVVLERGQVGETWRTQRWDSFALNTPNSMNGLPGSPYDGDDGFGFMSHHELVASFEEYVERFELDIRTGVTVTSVSGTDAGDEFKVLGINGGKELTFAAKSVVVASGIAQSPRIPPYAESVPNKIVQLSTGTYRSPGELPDGAVIVVGGGQSGAQIVEDLLGAGREVYFSISKVTRLPRRYRGRDFMDWAVDIGFWDAKAEDVTDPAMLSATNPLVSGVGPLGHTISFQDLARRGARLLGRLEGIEGGVLKTNGEVMSYIRHADEFSKGFRDEIDQYIEDNTLSVGGPEPDPADESFEGPELDFVTELDLNAAGVSTIIWSTGFTADFSWIELPVTDAAGRPLHHNGVSPVEGIYFIGFPWLSKRKSGVIYGIEEDATNLVSDILRRTEKASTTALGTESEM